MTPIRFLIFTLPLLLSFRLFAGELPRIACPEMGCSSGLTLILPAGPFSVAGAYHFQVVLEGGKQAICRGRLPFSSCDDAVTCEGPVGLQIDQVGCMLQPSQQAFGGLRLDGQTPSQLYVFIARDDVTLVDQSLRPSYDVSTPNGPRCQPACRSATIFPVVTAE